jgi:uncharacterized protein YybS (DUF2232 family)
MNPSAIVMLIVVSSIFGVGIAFCIVRALGRARSESYGEDGPPPEA